MDPVAIARLWLLIKPVKRIRRWRNKRRLKKGLQPIDINKEVEMFPKGTMTYTGIAVMVLSFLLKFLDLGDISAEDLASQIGAVVDDVVFIVGTIVAALGRKRATAGMVASK